MLLFYDDLHRFRLLLQLECALLHLHNRLGIVNVERVLRRRLRLLHKKSLGVAVKYQPRSLQLGRMTRLRVLQYRPHRLHRIIPQLKHRRGKVQSIRYNLRLNSRYLRLHKVISQHLLDSPLRNAKTVRYLLLCQLPRCSVPRNNPMPLRRIVKRLVIKTPGQG